jgi:hypothetical protein
MRPQTRRRVAGWLIVASLLGWPVTALTLAREEPQFVLGLSWIAITLTAVDVWSTTDVRAEGEED